MRLNYFLSALVSVALHGFVGVLFVPFNKIASVEVPATIEVVWEKLKASPSIVARETMRAPPRKNKTEIQRATLKPTVCRRHFVSQEGRRDESIHGPPQSSHDKTVKRVAYHPLPKYPWICRKRGEEGAVSFIVTINAEGRVGEMKLAKSSGYKRLDEAAHEGIQSWVFSEAHCQKSLTITFQLEDETSIKFK